MCSGLSASAKYSSIQSLCGLAGHQLNDQGVLVSFKQWVCACWLAMLAGLPLAHAGPPPEWGFVNLREGQERARQEQKPMFILFGFDNCPWCKVFYRNTLSDADLRQEFQRDFVLVYMSTLAEREEASYLLPDGRTLAPKEIVKDWKVYPVPSWRWVQADGRVLVSDNNAKTTVREMRLKAQAALAQFKH